MNIVTAADLTAESARLSTEEQDLVALAERLRVEADAEDVAAALTGQPAPASAAEKRQRANEADRRVAAIRQAGHLVGMANDIRQRIANQERAALQAAVIDGLEVQRRAALDVAAAAVGGLVQALFSAKAADDRVTAALKDAQQMARDGVISSAELRAMVPRRPKAHRNAQDRRTGQMLEVMSVEENLAILRQLLDDAMLDAVSGRLPSPLYIDRWLILNEAKDRRSMVAGG